MKILASGRGELFQPPDMFAFRAHNHTAKPRGLVDKVMTEQEAVTRFVADGDYIGTELYGTVRAPMSLCREVVRQGRRDLRVAGQGILELELLMAADLVRALDITYIGLEVYGVSHILRRAVESGRVKTVEWSNGAITWRFKAAAMGIPFIPVKSMLGTDTLTYSAAKVAECPFSGEKVALLPALVLDCGLVHVHRADKYGNCQIDGIWGFAHELARASRKLIISTEELVETEVIRRAPERTVIPYYLVDAVVVAPFGSHPGEMVYRYVRDEEHIRDYVKLTADAAQTAAYMKRHVLDLENHDQYLDLIGRERLAGLARQAGGA